MNLDIPTLVSALAVIAFSSAIVILIVHMLGFAVKGTLYWVYGSFSIAVSLVLNALYGILPDFISIVISNSAIFYNLVLYYTGFRIFLGRSSLLKITSVIPLIAIVPLYWLTLINPSIIGRVIVISIFYIGYSVIISIELFRGTKGKMLFAQQFTGYVYSMFALSNIVRFIYSIYILIKHPSFKSHFESGIVSSSFLLISIVFIIGFTTGMIMMISEKLQSMQQKAEIETIESLEKYQLLEDTAGGIIIIINLMGTILYINKAGLEISGYSKEEIINTNLGIFLKDEGINILKGELEKRIAGIKDMSFYETFFIHKNGHAKDVEVSTSLVIKNNKPCHVLIAGRDISDRKKIERALKISEAKHRTLFKSSRDAIMILDEEGFLDGNSATLDIFGCDDILDFIGKSPAQFSPPQQPDGTDSQSAAQKRIATAISRGSHFFEWMHCRLDGTVFPAEVMLSVLEIEGTQLIQALVRNITTRKQMEDELKNMALTDPLTGADNRRSFVEKAEKELIRSRRYIRKLAFLMMDIDHFKKINDTHGHHIGDHVLKILSAHCKMVLRENDFFGRLGGEEFGIALIEMDRDQAMEVAERLRADLASLKVEKEDGVVEFTVSIGLAILKDSDENLENLMVRADSALYRAKEQGRNRVCEG